MVPIQRLLSLFRLFSPCFSPLRISPVFHAFREIANYIWLANSHGS